MYVNEVELTVQGGIGHAHVKTFVKPRTTDGRKCPVTIIKAGVNKPDRLERKVNCGYIGRHTQQSPTVG